MILTERLLLREFTESDLKALYMILSDKETNTFLPWFPIESLKEAEIFLHEKIFMQYKNKGYFYAVCFKENNIPIGYIQIASDDSHDLGYGLIKDFWHLGITIEACKAVIEQLKKDGVPYITATHDVNNIRSGKVMKNLGMTYQYSYEEQCQPKNLLVTFRMYQLNFDENKNRVYKKYWNKYAVHYIEQHI